MSDAEDASVPRAVLRTVTPPYRGRPNSGMNAIGYAILLGLFVLLVPLFPVLLVIWLFTKLFGATKRRIS